MEGHYIEDDQPTAFGHRYRDGSVRFVYRSRFVAQELAAQQSVWGGPDGRGAWRAAFASSRISAGAFEGEPASKGGWGSYSMASCTLWARAGPYMRLSKVSAMSVPLETPAAVITFPRSTTRCSV